MRKKHPFPHKKLKRRHGDEIRHVIRRNKGMMDTIFIPLRKKCIVWHFRYQPFRGRLIDRESLRRWKMTGRYDIRWLNFKM